MGRVGEDQPDHPDQIEAHDEKPEDRNTLTVSSAGIANTPVAKSE